MCIRDSHRPDHRTLGDRADPVAGEPAGEVWFDDATLQRNAAHCVPAFQSDPGPLRSARNLSAGGQCPVSGTAGRVDAGVYFDGVASGRDCECCGDRWFRDPDGFATLKEAIASIPDWRTPDEDSSVYRVVRRPSTDEHESRE